MPRCARRRRALGGGSLLFAAVSAPAAADIKSPCPLHAPEGGYTSFQAWTAIFNAQPHHVASPFKGDLLPTTMVPGICSLETAWNSGSWGSVGMRGSDWMAVPKQGGGGALRFQRGDEDCSQELTGMGVLTAIKGHESIRLHFGGCSRPASILALRLTEGTRPSTGTGEPTVMGFGLLEWMCKVSPDQCKTARGKVAERGAVDQLDDVRLARGVVGRGRCSGSGVRPHPVADPAPATAAACASECQQRIARNLADPSHGSCRGYAWSEQIGSCIVYDGWPVTETEEDGGSLGYFCDNMTAVRLNPQPGAEPRAAAADPEEALLGIDKVFQDPRAVTARRMQVSPFLTGCFDPFDWYILDRWVNVPAGDLAVLSEMTRPTADYVFNHPSDGGRAPRSNLVVERVCLRDCRGALRGECLAQDGASEPPEGFRRVSDGSWVAAQSPEAQPLNASSALAVVVGGPAADVYTDTDMLPWLMSSAALAVLAGFGLVAGAGHVWYTYIATRPKYHGVEEVKLVYEGEEEETLALRSAADGNMTSKRPDGLLSTWMPSKALATATGNGLMGSSRNVAAPWATR